MASLLVGLFLVVAAAGIFFGLVIAVVSPFIKAHGQAKALAAFQPGALPYSRRKNFFSAAERSFYEVLHPLVPGYTVFAKVKLADLIYVARGTAQYQSHFNRIQCKHVDFVLCDQSLAPVLAIELDDSSHDLEHRRKRDAFVDAALNAAALPIVHIRAQRAYTLEEIRGALRPHLGCELDSEAATISASLPPVAERLGTVGDGQGAARRAISTLGTQPLTCTGINATSKGRHVKREDSVAFRRSGTKTR